MFSTTLWSGHKAVFNCLQFSNPENDLLQVDVTVVDFATLIALGAQQFSIDHLSIGGIPLL